MAPSQNTGSADSRPVICQVLHSLNVGGAEVLAARLARRLSSKFRFVFACLDELGTQAHELRQEGFIVEQMGRRGGVDMRCVRRLAAFARDTAASVIHAHQYTPFFYCRVPGWIGHRPPVLFTEHGRFYPDLPSRKRMVFNRLFLRRNDRVVAVGQAVKQALIANEGIASHRIQVIYNGVRLDDFERSAVLRREVRDELGIGQNTPVAVQVARLDYLKDHSTAIRTTARICQAIPEFQLLVVGEGPERHKIEREITAGGLSGNVRLLGLRTDVRRLLSAADLFLLTSISEGIPVTLIEAMAAELPVVATNVGGVPEVVVHNTSGVLTVAGDDAALAEGCIRFLSDENLRQTIGDFGRDRAQQVFNESTMHENYAEVYGEMLSKPAAFALTA